MLKQRFLKNSARVLLVSTAILFISNLIVLLSGILPGFESKIGWLSKLPDLSVYIFTFFAYLALNDEKSAHRKIKDVKSQKKINFIKNFLIFVFVTHFFKGYLSSLQNKLDNTFVDVVFNVFFIISSFSFFLFVLSLWYFFRDRNEEVRYVSAISTVISLIYTVYKILFYVNFNVSQSLFFSANSQLVMCLLQYSVNIFMFFMVFKYYEKKEIAMENDTRKDVLKPRPQIIECIEAEVGYGIDNVDDYMT